MSQENPKHCRNNCLQFYLTIPRCVTLLYDIQIDFNEDKDLFKDFNELPSSDDWSPYEYIDSDFKKKVEKTKGKFTINEMKKETKHYV